MSYCQTHACLCGIHTHTHTQSLQTSTCVWSLVYKKRSQMLEIVSGVTQSLSFWMCQSRALCFELWHLNWGLKSHELLCVDCCTLTDPTHLGGCWRLKVIVNTGSYWSIDHTERVGLASEPFITIPPLVTVKGRDPSCQRLSASMLINTSHQTSFTDCWKWDIINHFLISEESKIQPCLLVGVKWIRS